METVYLLTNGGPGTSTQVVTMFIYNYAFVRNTPWAWPRRRAFC
mgnify:CR=1 FL=1